jgi:hypothetical protein
MSRLDARKLGGGRERVKPMHVDDKVAPNGVHSDHAAFEGDPTLSPSSPRLHRDYDVRSSVDEVFGMEFERLEVKEPVAPEVSRAFVTLMYPTQVRDAYAVYVHLELRAEVNFSGLPVTRRPGGEERLDYLDILLRHAAQYRAAYAHALSMRRSRARPGPARDQEKGPRGHRDSRRGQVAEFQIAIRPRPVAYELGRLKRVGMGEGGTHHFHLVLGGSATKGVEVEGCEL